MHLDSQCVSYMHDHHTPIHMLPRQQRMPIILVPACMCFSLILNNTEGICAVVQQRQQNILDLYFQI